jgi:hypothetical protein
MPTSGSSAATGPLFRVLFKRVPLKFEEKNSYGTMVLSPIVLVIKVFDQYPIF